MSESDAQTVPAGVPERREDAETFAVQQLRAMEQPKWNEGRLDDLNKRVESGIGRLDGERKELRKEMREGFARVDGDIKDLRTETKEGFDKVDKEFKAVRKEMSAGFDRLFWKLVGTGFSVAGAAFGLAAFLS